jgi:ABC-type nitrate/sulfonate/bicarbonate transport system permease component
MTAGTVLRAARALGSVVALLAIWEIVARSGSVSPFLLPALSAVVARVAADLTSADFAANLWTTLYRAGLAFGVAAVVGVTLGTLMARVRAVRWFFDPLVSVGFPMPKISFLPVFILWFGIFDLSKITMTILAAVFPIVTATWAATESVDRYLIWSARNMGVGRRRLFWEVIVPAATPEILTGLQVALPIALIVVVVTEMLMGGHGLGAAMIMSARFADTVGVFAGIVETAVVGLVAIKGMERLRRRLLAWHPEAQATATIV